MEVNQISIEAEVLFVEGCSDGWTVAHAIGRKDRSINMGSGELQAVPGRPLTTS